MFKIFFQPFLTVELRDGITLRRFCWMEKTLCTPFRPVRWLFGGIRFQHRLYRGGGGVVFKAVYENREVVVKMPTAQVIKDNRLSGIEQLNEEYSVGKRLANIDGVPRYLSKKTIELDRGHGSTVSFPMLIIEYVAGESLHRIEGLAPKIDCIDKYLVFKKLLDIVLAIHAVGVVHKDINPANILIRLPENGGDDIQVWLVDFGASLQERRFSPRYGAPEQQMPLAFGDVGEACDFFSFGLVMYEFFEGCLPFDEDQAVKNIAGSDELILDFRLCRSRAVKEMLARMLVKEPAERLQNIEKIYQLVQHI